MLQMESDAIKNEAVHGSLSILEREMNVVLAYLNNVGTQAALLAGFVFSVFSGGVSYQGSHPFIGFLMMNFAAVSFSAFLYTIVVSTVSSSLGPRKALKGKMLSEMRSAVESMKMDRRQVVRAFAIGAGTFQVVCLTLVWNLCMDELWNAIPCTVIFLIQAFMCIQTTRRQLRNYVITEDVVAAVVHGDQAMKKMTGAEYLRRAEGPGEVSHSSGASAPNKELLTGKKKGQGVFTSPV